MPGPKDKIKYDEWRKKISLTMKGKKPKNYNSLHTIEMNKKVSNSLKGIKRSKDTIQKIIIARTGKKHTEKTKEKLRKSKTGQIGFWRDKKRGHWSKEHREKISIALRGEKSYNWKGGQAINLVIKGSSQYRLWRSNIFERDKWTCQTCYKRGCYLEAHHIKKFSDIINEYKIKEFSEALDCKELWDLFNGVTLCSECHNLTKNK